jgi:quinoprotein glucose dehydrogenase
LSQRNSLPSANVDAGHTRYVSLSQINAGNVNQLQPVWVYDTGAKGRGWEANPLVVNGVMYLSIPGAAVALDADTGKQLWKFVPANMARPGRDRGVAYWPGAGPLSPRVIYTTADRLYALDAKTGTPVSDFGEQGLVNLRDDVAGKYPNAPYSINSPAAIYKNLVILSPSTQEFGSRGPSGDPRAFDVITGKQVWRFHTVPQPGEPQSDSWGAEGWKDRVGPSAWGGATVDPTTGLVFIPIGNPGDSYNGSDRPGNNLYSDSLVALDAATGKLRWFYQFTHHDINDLDAPAAPSLLDIRRNGKKIPALIEVPKSGLAFILDRRTGKPVFGDAERSIPQSDVPGERSSPTQPFPLKPDPLVKMEISRDGLSTLTPEMHAYCTALWDQQQMHNEGPYTPVSTKGTTVFAPGTSGGGSWGGVSTDPTLGWFFANVSNMPTTSRMVSDGQGGWKLEGAYRRFGDEKGWPCIPPPWGELIAINANTGDVVWRSPLGAADDFGPAGKATGTPNLGGSVVTASGLIFIGATVDSCFRAFDVHTGKELWSIALPAPAVATPTSYRGNSGRQYVAIADGGPATIGMPGRFSIYHQILIAFALPEPGDAPVDMAGFAPLPAPAGGNRPGTPGAPPALAADITYPEGPGKDDFVSMCAGCHGLSTAVAVRRSSDGWRDLIQEMRSRGAPGDDAKAQRVHDYLTQNFGVLPDRSK